MFTKVRDFNRIFVDDTNFDFTTSNGWCDEVMRETQQHSHYGHVIYGTVMSASSTVDIVVDLNGGASWGQSDRVKGVLLWAGSANRQTQPAAQPAKGILACTKIGTNYAAALGKLASVQADNYGYRFFSQVRDTARMSSPIYSTALGGIRLNNAVFQAANSRVQMRFVNTLASTQSLFYRVTFWVWT